MRNCASAAGALSRRVIDGRSDARIDRHGVRLIIKDATANPGGLDWSLFRSD
jgi:hypothetical protein